jgi:hypothetical protein
MLERSEHVILERRRKIDPGLLKPDKRLAVPHNIIQLIKRQRLSVFLARNQPVRMQARDIQSEIKIAKDERVVEAVGDVLGDGTRVVGAEEVVDGELGFDFGHVGESVREAAFVCGEMGVEKEEGCVGELEADPYATFVTDPTANEACGNNRFRRAYQDSLKAEKV